MEAVDNPYAAVLHRREQPHPRLMNHMLFVSTVAAALGCGLIAGVFYAFSTFIMKALAALPPLQGVAAMQSINVVVLNPAFLGVFLGTAVVCAGLGVSSCVLWQRPGSAWMLAGSILYLVGTIFVTMAFNVPRNDSLAAMDPASAEAAKQWPEYVSTWTAWNHVRTAAALAAAASFTIGLCLSR